MPFKRGMIEGFISHCSDGEISDLPISRLVRRRQCGDPCAIATEEKLTEVYAGALPWKAYVNCIGYSVVLQ